MSDDQWNTPPQQQPPHGANQGSQNQQNNGWNVESNLPKPGESWDNAHNPQPIHEVKEDEWGTAPFDGSVQPPGQQGAPPPGPAPQQPQQPYPGYQQPGPGGYPQQQMTYQPNTAMTNTQLDNNDIIAIVLSLFFPGAGHIMLGQTTKGIAIIAAMILSCGIAAIAWPVVLIDVVMLAQAKKKRPVDDWELFPK